jgi:hypothetical protein
MRIISTVARNFWASVYSLLLPYASHPFCT